jgi:phage protein U
LWVVQSVEETASNFKQDGTPSKQEFNVSIKKFSDGT